LNQLILPFFFTPQPVALDPLPEGHTEFEAKLRQDLLHTMAQYPGIKENEINKALNAANSILHHTCATFASSLEVRGCIGHQTKAHLFCVCYLIYF
jgi:hypothetical protein